MTRIDVGGRNDEIQLEQGTIRYRDDGQGPVLLFVHGILVNSAVWRDVIPSLSGRFRCVAPDLPLGGHAVPMRASADLTPVGVARIVADLMDALDLRDVTLVGSDTGGAICQLVVARYPERLAGLVLTNCDAYEAFFPLVLRPLSTGARLLGTRLTESMAWLLQWRWSQRLLLALVARRRMDEATLDAYLASYLRDAGVRRDLLHFLSAIANRDTLEAARGFPTFHRPVLIVWGRQDFIFPRRLARRLAADFPDARLELVAGSRAFVSEDQPGILADLIAGHMDRR